MANPHRKHSRGRCLVLDAEGQSSLPVMESLAKQGYAVTAGSYKPVNMGFFSRYPSKRVLYPSPKTEPEAFVQRLLALVREGRYHFVFPIDDFSSELVSAHKESLTPFTGVPVVDFDIFIKGRDKSLTLKCARDHGIPHPLTRYPDEDPIAQIARTVPYPVLIKPNVSNGARGISLITNAADLEPAYRVIKSQYGECHIQEYIPKGGLQYKADLFLGNDDQLKAGIVYSKLRYYPVNGGSSVLNRTVRKPEILDYAGTLLRAMNWRGFADFDFIADPRDGVAKLMEINPRIPNCFRITQAAGIDFAGMIARHALGEESAPVEGYRTDVYLRYLPLDILWFLQSPERFQAQPSFFRFFGRDLHDQILSLRDPGPLAGFFLDNVYALFRRKSRAERYSRGWDEAPAAGGVGGQSLAPAPSCGPMSKQMRVDNSKDPAAGPLNVLSVDVEDYHNQLALEYQHRLEPPNEEALRCTERLLEIFADYQAKGTFFILGEIAQAFPELVRRIAAEGHHLGVHGYHHLKVTWQSPAQFRQSIRRAKSLIEDLTGKEADAYRAPWFSLNETTLWALDILADLGFRYDSSIFPIRARRYGIPSAPRLPYRHRVGDNRTIWEVPLTTVALCSRRLGACGGGHLRLFPLRFTQFAMRQLGREGRAAIVYLHPYEIEPYPRIDLLPGMSPYDRLDFRMYNFQQRVGRKTVERKVRWLLKNHRFGTVEELVASIEAARVEAAGRTEPRKQQAAPLSHSSRAAAI